MQVNSNIKKIYKLSPMQEGMLFQLLLDDKSNAYFEQMCFLVSNKLMIDKFRASFNLLIEKYDIFRTIFRYEKLDQPLQVVLTRIEPEFYFKDISNLEQNEQKTFIDEYKKNDKEKGFHLSTKLALRMAVFQTSENKSQIIWSFHHIIMDGWCIKKVISDLFKIYFSLVKDEPVNVEDPHPYSNYIKWLEKQNEQDALDYWKAYLNDYENIAIIPYLNFNNKDKKYKLEQQGFDIGESIMKRLEEISSKSNVTINSFFQTVWGILLQKYNNTDDVIFGAVVSGRPSNLEGVDEMIGLFINTIPIRIRNGDIKTFIELAGLTQSAALASSKFHYSSLAKIQSNTKLKQNLIHNLMVFENYPEIIKVGNLDNQIEIENFELDEQTNYDFNVIVIPGRSYRVIFNYNNSAYETIFVKQIINNFKEVLNQIIKNPQMELSKISLLSKDEKEIILNEFNNTDKNFRDDITLVDIFTEQVEKTPDNTALMYDNKIMTYKEFEIKVNQLAYKLRELGVKPNTIVGIMVERSFEMMIGLFAIIKAGGAYLPIDSKYPADRINYILEDSKINIVLTQKKIATIIGFSGKIIEIDDKNIYEGVPVTLDKVNKPTDLAYVIYTSGSTGKPKGTLIEHRSVINRLNWKGSEYPIYEDDIILQKTTYTFDVSVWELFWWMFSGAKLYLLKPGEEKDPGATVEIIIKNKISVLHYVPSMLNYFLEYIKDNDYKNKLTSLRYLFSSGEALKPEQVHQFYELCHNARLLNLYGPTEATIDVSYFNCQPDVVYDRIPIGKPIDNIKLLIIDKDQNLQPIGINGELCISGAGLARGYLNKQELTNSKFIPNPFVPGKLMYLTGDIARWLPDGNIDYLGRRDNQVKIRGFRIELDEIESTIKKYPFVKNNIVFPKEDSSGNKYLCAYIVADKQNLETVLGKQRYRLPNNLAIAHLNKNETNFMYYEIFEKKEYFKNGIEINDGDCIFDIGANIGMFSLYINQINKNTEIFTFEPIPPIYDVLKINMELYCKNVKHFNIGISDQSKEVTFTYYPKASIMSGYYTNEEKDKKVFADSMIDERLSAEEKEILVQNTDQLLKGRFESENYQCYLKSISDVIEENGIKQIDLLKIDVEKSELDVLNGIKEPYWSKIKQIVIEVHDIDGCIEKVKDHLEKHDFRVLIDEDELSKAGLVCVYGFNNNRITKSITQFIEPKKEDIVIWNDKLRDFLSKQLPDYMIPAHIIQLETLPLLPNGKIDKKRLPDPKDYFVQKKIDDTEEPKTKVEEILLEIWKNVLGIETIGINDNFFNYGGDSIKAIQVSARLNKFKMKINIDDIFQNSTIKSLSTTVKMLELEIDQSVVTGEFGLSPIQKQYFNQNYTDFQHFCQSVMLLRKDGFERRAVEEIFSKIVIHHDALRIIYKFENDEIMQFNRGIDDKLFELKEYNLKGQVNIEEQLLVESNNIYESFNLKTGPLLKIAIFSTDNGDFLLIAVNHLVIDGVSWRIILEDLIYAYGKYINSEVIELNKKTHSLKHWIQNIYKYASGDALIKEINYWKKIESQDIPKIQFSKKLTKKEEKRDNNKDFIKIDLNQYETSLLLKDCNSAFNTSIEELLISSLGISLQSFFNSNKVLINLEGHGRNNIIEGVDISRTIGWFTSEFPFLIDMSITGDLSTVIKSVKSNLRAVPNKGVGYGILKYITPSNLKNDLMCNIEPEIYFNYLGDIVSQNKNDSGIEVKYFNYGDVFSKNLENCTGIHIDGIIKNEEMSFMFYFNKLEFEKNKIEDLADGFKLNLLNILDYCTRYEQIKDIENKNILNDLPERKIIAHITPYTEVFYKDCFFNALFPVVKHFNGDYKCMIANDIFVYERDKNRKGLTLKVNNINIMDYNEILERNNISVKTMTRSDDIITDLKLSLADSNLVIIRVDCFYESYREDMYQKQHWPHAILIYGYDDKNQLFDVIEHENVDSINYKKIKISYNDIRSSYEGCLKNFHDEENSDSYFEYSSAKSGNIGNDLFDDYNFYIKNLINHKDAILYGIEQLNHFIDDIKCMFDDMDKLPELIDDIIYYLNNIFNSKNVNNFILSKMMGNVSQINEMSEKILENWEQIRATFIKANFTKKFNRINVDELTAFVKNIYELEKKQFEKIFLFIANEISFV